MSTTLTTELLLHRAGTKSYWRGLTYREAVLSLRVHSRHVAARVRGGDEDAYVVELSWSGTHLVGSCSCPHGSEGFFCKHCVAVGLVLLDRGQTVPPPDAEDVELKDVLRSLPPDVLRDLLYEQAAKDLKLRARIISSF
ncbi:SWIM zinc finger family protein [Lentzea jiangxiensis]|uniref:SWIM zinc finger family protein n=1 Tax=Lentzea jiangxiensis TaxID=641025 RepID=UPI0015A4C751|nr:SWIM zinc finger family protein [Lentzea jiangxiensis]